LYKGGILLIMATVSSVLDIYQRRK
jgi:hypothetical protein